MGYTHRSIDAALAGLEGPAPIAAVGQTGPRNTNQSIDQSPILHQLHHFLYPFVGSRTKLYILFVHMHVIGCLLFIVVRKTGTICGTYFVNRAFVVREVQELAGLFCIHPVANLCLCTAICL